MRNEGVLWVCLSNLPFIFWVDRGRDQRKAVGEIGTDTEHGHRLKGQIRVILWRRTGERRWWWVQRILSRKTCVSWAGRLRSRRDGGCAPNHGRKHAESALCGTVPQHLLPFVLGREGRRFRGRCGENGRFW